MDGLYVPARHRLPALAVVRRVARAMTVYCMMVLCWYCFVWESLWENRCGVIVLVTAMLMDGKLLKTTKPAVLYVNEVCDT